MTEKKKESAKENPPKPVIDTQDGSYHTFVAAPQDNKPVEVVPDVSGLPKAEDMASPFVADRSVPNDALLTDEDRKRADESGRHQEKKKSHLHQRATFYNSELTFEHGTIESEFDDGTVDIALGTGARRRIHLALDKDDKTLPRVVLGEK